MTKLTESAIEDFAIKLFERLGYDYIHAPEIAPDVSRICSCWRRRQYLSRPR